MIDAWQSISASKYLSNSDCSWDPSIVAEIQLKLGLREESPEILAEEAFTSIIYYKNIHIEDQSMTVWISTWIFMELGLQHDPSLTTRGHPYPALCAITTLPSIRAVIHTHRMLLNLLPSNWLSVLFGTISTKPTKQCMTLTHLL